MKKLLLCLLPVILVAAIFLSYAADTRYFAPASADIPAGRTWVIDAGHGGEDGGAVSVTGVPESQINLAIACKLEDILLLYGTIPKMLRHEDISLHDDTAATLREKKVSDLHNRVSIVESTQNPVLVSIHQNSYPSYKYHGAQTFYAPTVGSEALAQKIQQDLCLNLDPGNVRQARQIPDTVYLMNHISCPAVLVECGFLTNPEEESLLRQDGYQRKLAAILASTMLVWPEDINDIQEPLL